ncbi:hypothetical protein [Streptomyces sp. NBC_01518]
MIPPEAHGCQGWAPAAVPVVLMGPTPAGMSWWRLHLDNPAM